MNPAIPDNEVERLHALYEYEILDSAEEGDFDAVVKLASSICGTPISLISLIDHNRQWFKASVGVNQRQTTREIAFCAHAIHQDELMVVHDAQKDDRFSDNPLVVNDPHVRFYAGMPLITPEGYKLGTICVLDQIPHELTEGQKAALHVLAKQVMTLLELRKRNKELRKLTDMNKQLLSIIGHDIRSPLNSLLGLLELSEKYNLPYDEFKSSLPKIRKTLNATSSLLTNLLEWALSQMPGKRVSLEPLEVAAIADKVIETNAMTLESKGNIVQNAINPDLKPVGNRNMTEFIIRNLLLNANKFTDEGIIRLSATSQDGFLEIEVRDTGVGMEVTDPEEIFSWGVRKSKEGTQGEKGSGLGLSMCKQFIEMQGGTIRFTSTLDEGTSFFFTLPEMN